MIEKVNYELFVKYLNAIGEKEFELLLDWGDGVIEPIYWPHLFLLKYKAKNVYSTIVEDPNNECYLCVKLFYLLCIRMDTGIEGIDIEPLLKFTVQKLGGITYDEVSCDYAKNQLLKYQNYLYDLDPSLKEKVFFPLISNVSLVV